MPQVTIINHQGQVLRAAVQGAQADDLLWSAGVDCGRWAPRPGAVSSLPQLSYARELIDLQKRFACVMTQRRRWSPGRAWTELQDLHVHDDLELRVVLQGVLRVSLCAMTLGGWLQVDVAACEWVALPAQLPHAAAPDAVVGVDMLCLFTRPGGWLSRPLGSGPAPGLRPGPGGLDRPEWRARPPQQREPSEQAGFSRWPAVATTLTAA